MRLLIDFYQVSPIILHNVVQIEKEEHHVKIWYKDFDKKGIRTCIYGIVGIRNFIVG